MPPRTPNAKVRRYHRSQRVRRAALQSIAASFDGIWLGALDPSDLGAIDAGYYDGEPKYTDAGYNTSGLHEWELRLVESYLRPGARVAVTGAGGGREVLGLLEMGFDAVGFEPHPQLVATGSDLLERRGYPERLLPMERDDFPAATAGACDAVILGWGSYMLIPGRARRVSFLLSARRALLGGGPLILSFFTRSGSSRYFDITHAIASAIRRARRQEAVDYGDALVPNFAHHFTRGEIAAEVRDAGLELAMFESHPYGHAVALAGAGT